MKAPDNQLAMFDLGIAEAPKPLSYGSLLPVQQSQMIDVVRAAKILDVSRQTAITYINLGLIGGYRAAERLVWSIYYDTIVELCDAMRLRFMIRDRRPRLAAGVRRWRDEDLLPFPAADTVSVETAADALAVQKTVIHNLINDRAPGEPGVFDAYRFTNQMPWRISQISLRKYAEERARSTR
jgi:hypothetical protein